MLEMMWSKGNTPPLMVGVQTNIVAMEISRVISQKIGNRSILRSSNSTHGHIPQGHLLNAVLNSIIHNNQNLETTYIPIN